MIVEYILSAGAVLGYLLIFLVVFGETGTLFGVVLPGDSFLFALGIAAASSHAYPNIYIFLAVAIIAAIGGDTVGYLFGKRVGVALYKRPDSRWFKQSHVQMAKNYYERYGGSALIIARFTPVVRSLAPMIAGVAEMPYQKFIMFNVVGGILWVLSMSLLGYFLGSVIPNIEHYVLPIVAVVIVASVALGYSQIKKGSAMMAEKPAA